MSEVIRFPGRPSARLRDPFALARGDAELIAAEKEIAALLATAKRQSDAGDDSAWAASLDEVFRLDGLVATTAAATLAGAAVKLRRMLDPNLGLANGEKDSDLPCLHQILAAIEREAGQVQPAPISVATAGGTDPLIPLGAERVRLVEQINAPGQVDDDAGEAKNDKLYGRLCKVEDQIERLVPISGAGAAALVRFIQYRRVIFNWDERDDRIADNLIAGLEHLGETAAREHPGVHGADAEILSLFRQWIEAQREGDRMEGGPAHDAVCDRISQLEYRIADLPACGLVGLSVKAYFVARDGREALPGADPAGVSAFETRTYGDDPEKFVDARLVASLLRDASRFVPDIAPLAVPVIGAGPMAAVVESGGLDALLLSWLSLRESCQGKDDDEDVARIADEMTAVERAILAGNPATESDWRAVAAMVVISAREGPRYANVGVLEDLYLRLVVDRMTDPGRSREQGFSRRHVECAKAHLAELALSDDDGSAA
jgi:hypothetical protein